MSGRLTGRVAFVTGSSRDIGRAIALRLAQDGADVAIHCKERVEVAKAVAAEISALGRRASVTQGDLGDVDAIPELFAKVRQEHGRLDIFVANAAASAFRHAMDLKSYNVDRTFAISVRAFVLGAQQAAALMSGGAGSIIAISGMDASRYMDLNPAKGAAKAALETFVRYFAYELGPRGIRVNAVRPGYVHSAAGGIAAAKAGIDYATRMRERAAATPLRRNAMPDDIAGVVAFLASDDAAFVTGETIVVDGGISMTVRA